MDYKFILVDGYKVLIHNQHGFMSLQNVIKILNSEHDKVKEDLDNRVNNNQNTDIEYISYLDESYYSLDVIVMMAFDYDYKIAFELYDCALKEKIIFNNFVNDTIAKEKISFKEVNEIIKNNEHMIQSFNKYEKSGQEINCYGNFGYITIETIQIMIGLIKENYNFSDNFGVIRDYTILLDILYFTNFASSDDSNEIEFGNDDDVCYIIRTMYNIIKKKPFVSGNEIIASLIAYYYLKQSNLIEDEGNMITTSDDISLACGLIINSTDSNVVETLKKVKSLLAKHDFLLNSHEHKQLSPIIDKSQEGIINYIISSIESFRGYQGYYDYFKGKSCVYKIHYHGSYNNIFLDKAKTFMSDKTLFFKGTLHCFSEAPNDLINREELLKEIVEEIKVRSYNDVIIPFLKKIKEEIKPYFDLDSISIEFNFEIKTKFDEDYDW